MSADGLAAAIITRHQNQSAKGNGIMRTSQHR